MRAIAQNLKHLGYRPLHGRAEPSDGQQARAQWDKFGGRPSVQKALLDEQYQLCCYSEVRADMQGWGHHIEHLENIAQNPARTFDPTNLAASALAAQDLNSPALKPSPTQTFGGHAKGKSQGVDMARFVSCHQPDCARFFAYLSDGRIVPAIQLNEPDSDRAQYTIDLLNLNSPVLRVLRQQWFEELQTSFTRHVIDLATLTPLIASYLEPVNQKLQPFFSLTRGFFAAHAHPH